MKVAKGKSAMNNNVKQYKCICSMGQNAKVMFCVLRVGIRGWRQGISSAMGCICLYACAACGVVL